MEQKVFQVVNELKKVFKDDGFNYEIVQQLQTDGRFKVLFDIKGRLKLDSDYHKKLESVIDLLKETFPKRKFVTEDGTEKEEHPFSLMLNQSNYQGKSEFGMDVSIKIGEELDTFGATVFGKKLENKTKTTTKG